MQKHLVQVAAIFVLAGVCGCTSQGLSSRETGMQSYSEIVYPSNVSAVKQPGFSSQGDGTPDISPTADVPVGAVHLDLPVRISVVQVGELSPPDTMLAALRGHPTLFRKVSPQIGMLRENGVRDADPHLRLTQMREMARNLGSQYLLVFGGDIESGQQETGLAVFNLTIVGAFVVPSTGVSVSGKAAGSLVDVSSGRVLMNFSSDTKGTGLAPSAFAANAMTVAIDGAKQTLVKKLTADVVEQMGEQVKPNLAIAK